MIDLDFLFAPMEQLDATLGGLFSGAPLPVALGLAFVLGLRHASDPDHLVAVTSVVAAENGDAKAAVRLGAWWGIGHSLTLIVIGIPLIAFKSDLPGWLERGAEVGVGLVIVALASRVTWKWVRGDYRAGAHIHGANADVGMRRHHHLRREGEHHGHVGVRGPRQAFAIGFLHGLAGTGAVVVLLIAGLPTQLEAAAALLVFAPMSIASMAGLTGVFAWFLTRPIVEPLYHRVLIPALGMFGVLFGLWYVGLG